MNNSLQIEAANANDLPSLLRMIRSLAEYERLLDSVVITEAGLHEAMFSEHAFVDALIARLDDRAVGFALYFQTFSTFRGMPSLYLEDLFVEPEFRGKGIGRRLLARLAAVAVERNCGRMEWSVLDWNEMALRVYRKLGAEAMSEWTVHRLSGEALARLAAEANTPA